MVDALEVVKAIPGHGLTAALKTKLGAEFQNKMVMVNLGSEWRELSEAGKAKFVAMAEAQKAELAAQA